MNRLPQSLTTSLNSDVTHYAVLSVGAAMPDGMQRPAYFEGRTLEDSCSRAETIRGIIKGEFGRIAKVFAFNPVEHTADDVTEEIAVDCANSLDPTEPISTELRDFIERHAGLAYTRGLRVDDKTFWAA